MKPCPYCGNNPVPHLFYWQNESLNIFLTPLRQKLLYNRATQFLNKKGVGIIFAKIFLRLAEFFKIISKQTDPAKCKVRRAQVMWEEAEKRGIVMEELLLFGKPIDVYVAGKKLEIRKQKLEIIFSGLPRPVGYSNKWLDLMDDKWLFKKLMMSNNLPVPLGESVSSFDEAVRIFKKIQNSGEDLKFEIFNPKPVIVKPRSGSRGRHSTTYVSSETDLKQAIKVAKQLCFWAIVEDQLAGPVYRATLINFKLCGVLRGDGPQIIGDGRHSIGELIKIKNSLSHPGVKDVVPDKGMERFLERQNLNLSAVPAKDIPINLSEKIGVNYGGSSSEDFEICHPDNKELFVKAAKALGDPIVGFDFIISDIAKSYKEQKCGFIEVNSLPFINLHHDPLLGRPRNVAVKVWEMVGW